MYSNAKVIGDCKIGSNVIFAANSFVINMNIPSNSIVLGQYPNIIIKPNDSCYISQLFKY